MAGVKGNKKILAFGKSRRKFEGPSTPSKPEQLSLMLMRACSVESGSSWKLSRSCSQIRGSAPSVTL